MKEKKKRKIKEEEEERITILPIIARIKTNLLFARVGWERFGIPKVDERAGFDDAIPSGGRGNYG